MCSSLRYKPLAGKYRNGSCVMLVNSALKPGDDKAKAAPQHAHSSVRNAAVAIASAS
jgi:hypothetical protein